ncbi:helix-turn-helix domain-containing protein [Sphingomonas melonis]
MVTTTPSSPKHGARKPASTLDLAFAINTGEPLLNLALIHVARLGNRDGRFFMSRRRFANRCGFSESTAKRMIKRMIDLGFIETDRAAGSKRRTTTYRLLITRWKSHRAPTAVPDWRGSIRTNEMGLRGPQNHESESGTGLGSPTRKGLTSIGTLVEAQLVSMKKGG